MRRLVLDLKYKLLHIIDATRGLASRRRGCWRGASMCRAELRLFCSHEAVAGKRQGLVCELADRRLMQTAEILN